MCVCVCVCMCVCVCVPQMYMKGPVSSTDTTPASLLFFVLAA